MPVLDIDTATFRAPDRVEAWSAAITSAFGPFGIARNDPEHFHGRVRVERRQDIRFVELGYDGHGFCRSRRDVSKLDDAYYSLMRPVSGRLHIVQDGIERVLEPGQFYLINHAVPYETTPEASYLTAALAFPPAALEARVARPQPFYSLKSEPSSPRSQLLEAFLTQYAAGRAQWSDAEFERLTTQLLDLIVMAIVEPGSTAGASETSTRAAHRERALRHIRAHAARRDLTPRTLAEACGISLAYLHEIFRTAGDGVEDAIFAERLDLAARLLRAPDFSGEQIAAIAYRSGFSDAAHFTRAFRRRFAMTPGEWRRGG